MTVKQLIEQMQAMPQDLEVYTFNATSEDWDKANTPKIIKEVDSFPYCKACYPEDHEFPLILI